MKISYFGHSCFLVETGGKRLLFDPFGFIKIDHDATQKAFSEKGKELILMNVGAQIEI